MEISGSKAFIGSYSKGPSIHLRENRAHQSNLSYNGTINWLLLYATHINLIALVVCSLNLTLHGLRFQMSFGQYTKLKLLFHLGRPLQLLQQASDYLEIWFCF